MKFFLIFLLLPFFLFAQSYDMNIDIVTPMGTYFNTFYPSDFNPEQPENQPIFFQITISQLTGFPISDFQIYIKLTWGGSEAEVWLTPEDTALPMVLTNRDVINNNPVGFDSSGNYDNVFNAIEDYVLQTGRMPDGNYFFLFRILDQSGNQISADKAVTIKIESPVSISLITPGTPLGGYLPMNLMNTNPEFIWFSNLANFSFQLYHIDENIDTAEDIEALQPYYEEILNSNTLIYPSSAPQLEDGESYAWRVSAPVVSPGVNSIIKSIFYTFNISLEKGSPVDEIILMNFLNQINSDYIQVLLYWLNSGYNLSNITWQGQQISADELHNILNQILNGELILDQ